MASLRPHRHYGRWPDRRVDRARRARARRGEHDRALRRQPDVRQRARELGLGEVFDDAETAVANADLVVLAVPVGAMGAPPLPARRGLKAGAIVTDVGSVKQAVVSAVAERCRASAISSPAIPSPAPSIPAPTPALPRSSTIAGTS